MLIWEIIEMLEGLPQAEHKPAVEQLQKSIPASTMVELLARGLRHLAEEERRKFDHRHHLPAAARNITAMAILSDEDTFRQQLAESDESGLGLQHPWRGPWQHDVADAFRQLAAKHPSPSPPPPPSPAACPKPTPSLPQDRQKQRLLHELPSAVLGEVLNDLSLRELHSFQGVDRAMGRETVSRETLLRVHRRSRVRPHMPKAYTVGTHLVTVYRLYAPWDAREVLARSHLPRCELRVTSDDDARITTMVSAGINFRVLFEDRNYGTVTTGFGAAGPPREVTAQLFLGGELCSTSAPCRVRPLPSPLPPPPTPEDPLLHSMLPAGVKDGKSLYLFEKANDVVRKYTAFRKLPPAVREAYSKKFQVVHQLQVVLQKEHDGKFQRQLREYQNALDVAFHLGKALRALGSA